MQMTKKQAEAVGKLFDLPEEAVMLLQAVPYKGSLPTAVPTDPLIYRFYEIVNVYGTTFKELIHEEFGDGIMSAIDFSMDLTRLPNEKGDRVHDRDVAASSCRTRPTRPLFSASRSRCRTKAGVGLARLRHVLERVAVVGLPPPTPMQSRGTISWKSRM